MYITNGKRNDLLLRRKIVLVFVLLTTLSGFGQVNLVPNPGFEQYSTCPNNQNQVDFAVGWYSFGDTPDYFNSCSINSDFNVPYNWGGYQEASNGNGYCAVGTYVSPIFLATNVRDFIGTSLSTPLQIGTKYYVSFRTSLSLSPTIWANCSCNNLGGLFSVNQTIINNGDPLPNYAHIKSDTIIADSLKWTTIFGSFIADSSYQYISLGNFFEDGFTDTLIMDGDINCKFSYYYLDDICVSTDSIYCLNYSSAGLSIGTELNLQVFPNPIINELIIDASEVNGCFDLNIYNPLGRRIYSEMNIASDFYQIDAKSWDSGVLFLEIIYEKSTHHYELLKM